MEQFHFFTDERIAEFWGIVKVLLTSVSPVVMIGLAVAALALFIPMVVGIIRNARKKDGKDEEDFEYREY